jgi:hypothetical protein
MPAAGRSQLGDGDLPDRTVPASASALISAPVRDSRPVSTSSVCSPIEGTPS